MSAGQILIEEIRAAIDALKGCVTPILGVNDKGHAVLIGSAVLIVVASETFLCTARHVLDENATSTLYIDGPSRLEVLEGDFWSSPATEHDIAVLKLTNAQIQALKKYQPLAEDEIANQTQAENCKYIDFVGFPETKNRKVHRQNKLKGLIQAFGGIAIDITPARVLMKFDSKRMIDAKTRQRVTPPDPQGMSGGAMFGVPVNAATIEGTPRPKLIGITTDRRSKSKEVFGSSIAIVMAIIREGYKLEFPQRLNPTDIHIAVSATKIRTD